MLKLAIVGAGGFVGSRAVELFHLTTAFEVRAVVRRPASMAGSARFKVDCRVADVCDRRALADAFRGCDAVLHLATGDPPVITGGVRTMHDAAVDVGVRRIVYMSSASVHGQALDPSNTESTPLHERHLIAYNNAKVRSEALWLRVRELGRIEIVVLRPAIVFSPRSWWIASRAEDILQGRAYFVKGGEGVCNALYVDNLLHAVRLPLTVPQAAGGTFFVGDRESLTWRQLYLTLARALGIEPASIPNLDRLPGFRPSLSDRLRTLKSTGIGRVGLQYVSASLRRSIKAALVSSTSTASAAASQPRPQPTLEMALLQQCKWQLPWSHAAVPLGHERPVSVDEGIRRSIAWLRFAGYPVSR